MELPGFQIQREVGRGGMAHVHVAVQRRFGRLVALKVVAETLAQDPDFRRRFIQEARVNARLTHSNIVQVYDVVATDEVLYLVMEYVGGGDLNGRLARGMSADDVIGVVKGIGRALDYAHGRGFVHRDIKPENILFREDGTPVLSDFGIARAVDSAPSISQTGTVVGTPQYMSPEQATGAALDGRSDLYSLGVVLFRMLTGTLPFRADNGGPLGVKHLQESVPRLPSHLVAFQGVVDRAMAKKPEDRFQSGAEFGRVLEAVPDRPRLILPKPRVRSEVVTTQEIRAVGAQLFTARDPSRAERSSTRRRRRRLARTVVSAVLLVVLIGGGSMVLIQRPDLVTRLSAAVGIVDDPMVQEAWNSARSLREDPNQSLATIVAGYRRVLSLDPDHQGAQEALAGMASQWKADVQNALKRGNLAQADTKLVESTLAFPDDPELRDLAQQITNRKHAKSLLASTQGLLRSHGLSDIPSATAAIQAYQEVLRLAPGDPVARQELDALAQHYARLADESVDAGKLDAAIEYLDRASAASRAVPALAAVRDKIQQATTAQGAITDMLQQASRYRADGALLNPPGKNAAELYHRVLATDPDNQVAAQGLNEVVSQLVAQANTMLASGDLATVRGLVDRASAVGLDQQSVNRLKSRLDVEIARRDDVQLKLDQAANLLQRGFITEPAERNAVALLRDVERLDPSNGQARDLLRRGAERLAEAAQDAHAAGLSRDAQHYLELALTVAPDVAKWRDLRAQWEQSDTSL